MLTDAVRSHTVVLCFTILYCTHVRSYVFNVVSCGTLQMIIYWRIAPTAENAQSVFGAFHTTMMVYVLLTLTTTFYHGDAFKIEQPDIAAGRHGLASAMLADLLVCATRVTTIGCVLAPLIFFGCGFSRGHDLVHLFDFLVPIVMVGIFADSLGLFMLYASFNESFMGTFTGPTMGIFALYSGYFIKLRNTPSSIAHLCRINPIRACEELFITSHFGGVTLECGDVPPEERTVPCPLPGDVVLSALDYKKDAKMHNGLVLLLAPLLLRLLAYIAFRLNTQGRSGRSGRLSLADGAAVESMKDATEQVAPVDVTELLAESDSDEEPAGFNPTSPPGLAGAVLLEEEEEEESDEEEEEEEDDMQAEELPSEGIPEPQPKQQQQEQQEQP